VLTPIRVPPEAELEVWGVVMWTFHKTFVR